MEYCIYFNSFYCRHDPFLPRLPVYGCKKQLKRKEKEAYESGKAEILNELEKRNQVEKEVSKTDDEDIEKTVSQIMTGIKSGQNYENRQQDPCQPGQAPWICTGNPLCKGTIG